MLHRLIATVDNQVFSEIIFCRGSDRRIPQNRDYLTKRQAKIALRKHASNSGVKITGFYIIPVSPDPAAKEVLKALKAEKHQRRLEHIARQKKYFDNRHP